MIRPPPILLITDRHRMSLPIPEAISRALEGLPQGSAGVVLRDKDLDGAARTKLAFTLREITFRHRAPLFVAARVDIAVACKADGVTIGHDSPPFDEVRRIAPLSLAVGVAIHGDELPPRDCSFAMFSPIFETASKQGVSGVGLDALRARVQATDVPIYALGGVDETNAAACLEAGACGVAIIGAVLGAADPAEAGRRIAEALQRGT